MRFEIVKNKLEELTYGERTFRERFLLNDIPSLTIRNGILTETDYFHGLFNQSEQLIASSYLDPIFHIKPLVDENMDRTHPGKYVLFSRFQRYINTNIYQNGNHKLMTLIYVLKGGFNLILGGKCFFLNRGNVALLNPNSSQSFLIDNDDTIVLCAAIIKNSFRNTFVDMLSEGGLIAQFFHEVLFNAIEPQNTIFYSPPDERLEDTLLEIMEIQENGLPYNNQLVKCLTEFFIYHLFSHYEKQIYQNTCIDKTAKIVDEIVSYMCNNYTDISLKSLSEEFSYSSVYISRLLKRKLDKSYMEIIEDIKFQKSRELLMNSSLCFNEICWLVGYKDPRHLRSIYKKRLGVTPSEARKGMITT